MKKAKSLNSFVKIGIYLLCLIILLIIPLLRNTPNGDESFLYLRLANNPSTFDPLSYGGRNNYLDFALPFVLSFFPSFLYQFIPVILGLISFFLFGKILSNLNIKEKRLSLILLIISPTFIYLFGTINKHFVATFLCILSFFLITHKNKSLNIISLFVLPIIPFFNFALSFIFNIFILLYYLFENKKRINLIAFILMSVTLTTYSFFQIFITQNSSNLFFNLETNKWNALLTSYFSEFGALFGLGIFALILAIFGIVSVWQKKYQNKFIFFSFSSFLILSIFIPETIIFINLILVYFTAKGFNYLYKKNWEDYNLKKLTIFILICGLIFSSLSFINEKISEEPNIEIQKGMTFLKEQEFGTVFSHPSRGHWITYTNKTNLMDTNYIFAPNVKKRWNDTQTLLNTRDIKIAEKVINKYNINYIWLDKTLKDNVWINEEEGLQFILKYDPHFKKIYDKEGVGIWKIISFDKKE